jgi:hypothetical protein
VTCSVGDAGAGLVLGRFLLRCASEQSYSRRPERFCSILVLERPVGYGDAGHTAGPQIRPFPQSQEGQVAAIGPSD